MTGAGEADNERTFEELMEELEATVASMARGNLGIEEVTDLYERAGRLHAAATERLAAVQARIDNLTSAPTPDAPAIDG
ncbi:MAG: exodeoxyribonuclease VII small subunit [Actinobacteria bacterium]|nr:exodeoxyribonuclease VII small subunit [Actinomycetota bacterium]MBW3649405.1 exodeoxyribonuclease VII small subunit [Actinomycetota bacterium]